MLKSRSSQPPGGWQYLEAATGWRLPPGLGWKQSVQAIINHRLQNRQHNLPTDPDVVANQLDDYTCAILGNNPSYCVTHQAVNFTGPLPSRSQRVEGGSVAGASKFLANTTAGIKLWLDWFGDGKPVEKSLADQRAEICATCPQNKKGGILEWFTGQAAKEILAIFSALNDLNLHTPHDAELNVCVACDCPLKAKVWAPLSIIKKHMPEKTQARLDPRCWILHEGGN